jgi:hypothetical protein
VLVFSCLGTPYELTQQVSLPVFFAAGHHFYVAFIQADSLGACSGQCMSSGLFFPLLKEASYESQLRMKFRVTAKIPTA